MRSPLSTIEELGHIATRRQLVARGFSGYALTTAVRRGEIRRIRRGWYASSEGRGDRAEAVRVGGRLSHSSAARDYGLWPGFDTRLHITVTRGASRLRWRRQPSFDTPDNSERETVVHWVRRGRQDLTSTRTWRVGLVECLRQMVATTDEETAIACLDTAMAVHKLKEHDIRRIFRTQPKRSRRLAALARVGSDSGPESIVRQRLKYIGVRPAQQVSVPGVGLVDMLVDGFLVIEIDGRMYHSDPSAFENDRRRDALLTAAGFTVLRFSYRQVMFDWPFVVGVIRDCVPNPRFS